MKDEEVNIDLTTMNKEAERIESECADKQPAKVCTPQPSYYIIDCNFEKKPVLIALSLVIAFAAFEFIASAIL